MSMMRLWLTYGLDDQPGVSLSHGYYNNFVRHVLDSYSQGLLAQKKVTSYEAVSQHGSNACEIGLDMFIRYHTRKSKASGSSCPTRTNPISSQKPAKSDESCANTNCKKLTLGRFAF
jgi:hypothetical protein